MNKKRLYQLIIGLSALFCVSAASADAPNMSASSAKDTVPAMINLNFRDANIMAIFELYSTLLGKTIIPDENIRGKVTVISPVPLAVKDAVALFHSILDMKQLAMVEYDSYFKIVKKQEAAQSGMRVNFKGQEAGDQMQTGIIHLEYADAEDIVKDLSRLLSKDANIFAARNLNYIIVTATDANIRKIEAIIKAIDKPGMVPETRAYKLQYQNSKELSLMLAKMFDSIRSKKDARVTIVPIIGANSMIVTATSSQHDMIKKLIGQLDIRKKQVSISAMLVEISLTERSKMGLEWLLQESGSTTFNLASDLGNLFKSSANVQKIIGEGLKLSVLNADDFEILMHFLANTEDAKIISTPHILAMENHEARFRVGNEVPVKKGSRYDSNNNEIITFEQFKVGLEMIVTPVIADNRDITMKISQKLSNLVSFDEINGTYKSSEREASTTVIIKDKETLVIGGLISHEEKFTRKGIPGLKDLPAVGSLFSSKDDDLQMRELLIFITPTVIMDEGDGQQLNRLKKISHPTVVEENGIEFDL